MEKSNDSPSQSQSTMIQPVFNKENLNLTGSSLHEFNHYCNVEFFVYACMILVCLPPPQVALHSLHSVHSVHTGHSENHKVDLNYILSKLTLINKQHVHREAMSTGVTFEGPFPFSLVCHALRWEFIKESKKTIKQELDQESDQVKKKVFSFFLGRFLGRVLVFSCFLGRFHGRVLVFLFSYFLL